MQIKHADKKNRFDTRAGLLVALFAAATLNPLTAVAVAGEPDQPRAAAQWLASGGQTEIATRPRIQVAILLDTSNSMDGLIDQTRNQLWQVVNEFAGAEQDGVAPILEIALFEYGNDGISAGQGYLRAVNAFTRELDAVSAGLFSLTTNGGSEFCGYAIQHAVNALQWSQSENDIKTIFIAGNESFAQGPVDYRNALRTAESRGISVNTIHAGGHEQGIQDQWQAGALLAGGDYFSIDADQAVVHLIAPQDARIAELNTRLNQTYLPFGSAGSANAERQKEQDVLSSDISVGLLAKRAVSKSTGYYRNAGWDLVDALDGGALEQAELEEMAADNLPMSMQGLTPAARLDFVRDKARQRKAIQLEILELSQSRADYVAEQKRAQATAAPSMSDALTDAIRKQAREKNFSLKN